MLSDSGTYQLALTNLLNLEHDPNKNGIINNKIIQFLLLD